MPLPRLTALAVVAALFAALAGCAAWPEITIPDEAAILAGGDPGLVPLGPLLAQGTAVAAAPPAPPAANRIAALNARAAALRGQAVVPGPVRARMTGGVDLRGLPPPGPASPR